MITFKSKYIEEKVREKLKINETPLTAEDLERINGFLINEETEFCVPIVWFMDSSAYKMTLPNLHLNYAEMLKTEGWEDDLRLFPHIKALYYYSQIPLDLINSFTKLNDLTLHEAEISDWSFLAGLRELRMIHLYKCGDGGNEALRNICKLQYEQAGLFRRTRVDNPRKALSCNVLEHIAVNKMSISDLTPFRRANLKELDLSRNAISDISPLVEVSAHCLNMSCNKIEDISNLRSASCLINLKHNKIKTIAPIIEKSMELPACFYIAGNNIPIEDLRELSKNNFTGEDFVFYATVDNTKREFWRFEKVTYKNGRPRLDKGHPGRIGNIVADINIEYIARWTWVLDNQGKPKECSFFRSSIVKQVKNHKDGIMRITTSYSIYTLRRLSEEETAEVVKILSAPTARENAD
jgi:hypothetical protein